jgi:hypothetical protein
LQSDGQEQIEWFAAGGTFRRYGRPREAVRLPEGDAIAILRRRGDIAAVSQPMTIRRGVAQEARWEQPAGDAAQMVALLTKPRNERANDPAALTLASETSRRRPDVGFETDELLLGIWYKATPARQSLEVQSTVVHLPENEVDVRRGRLNVVEAELRSLPSLVISAGDEAGDEHAKLVAVIRDAASGAAVRETSVRLGEPVKVEHLPPRQLQVVLSVGEAWRFSRAADLRHEDEVTVDFALSPFRVAGELIQGDRTVKGTVSFRSEERWFAVDTDDHGRFEFEAWSAGRYIYEARAAGDERARAYSSTIVLSASTPEIAIRLPSERLRVRVTDAETGAPLKDAAVLLRNTWIDPEEGQRRFASRFAVNADGEAALPPIHAGEAELAIEAPGYASERQTLAVARGTDRLIRIALRREEASTLRITLPNGLPAAGAEAAALVGGVMTGWRGATDADGRLQVPDRLRGSVVLVRHRDAASAAVLFDDVVLARGTVRLQAPAAELLVRTEGAGGPENPVVVIWLDGVRLDGWATAFAVWAGLPFVDHSGVWRARNLPPGDVRVLITSPRNADRVRTGTLDAVFTAVKFPWASVVPVRVTECYGRKAATIST